MKRIILMVMLFAAIAFGQSYEWGVFGTSSAIEDTVNCTVGTDSVQSRLVVWPGYFRMVGNHTVYGRLKILSGNTPRVFTIKYQHYFGSVTTTDTDDLGAQHTLGTKTVTDSVKFEYNIPGQTWDKYSRGFMLTFVPDSTTSSTEVKCESSAK